MRECRLPHKLSPAAHGVGVEPGSLNPWISAVTFSVAIPFFPSPDRHSRLQICKRHPRRLALATQAETAILPQTHRSGPQSACPFERSRVAGGAELGECHHHRAWGAAQRAKAEVLVEARGRFIDGVDYNCADGELLGCDDNPRERVAQQRRAETAVLVATVHGEPRKDRDRDRVVARHALAGLLGRCTVVEFARKQRVIADHNAGIGDDEAASCVASFALPCVADQPAVQSLRRGPVPRRSLSLTSRTVRRCAPNSM